MSDKETKKVKVKCSECNGTGRRFKHSKEHEENQDLSCWACGCGDVQCNNCEGNGYVLVELFNQDQEKG